MEKKVTVREKILLRSERIVSQHKFLKLPMLLYTWLVLGLYGVAEYFTANGKRFLSLLVFMLVFTISTSFCFPGTAEETIDIEALMQQEEGYYDSQVTLVTEAEVRPEDVTILDDEDVLEGYEDAELHGMEDADKYTLDEILGEDTQYSGKEAEAQSEEGEEVVFDKQDWRLVLINKQHPIPEDYTFTLGTIKGSMKCDERIIDDLLSMMHGAKNDGVNLVICSPYRDMSRQEVLFNRKITKYMSEGMSYMEAYSLASQAVTVPGASEHQIGLAIDIVCDTYVYLEEEFENTEAGKWLAEHSCEYGFILRYPRGKEYITGIEYEPWHFRYVGRDAAMEITEKGLCLEEFIEGL